MEEESYKDKMNDVRSRHLSKVKSARTDRGVIIVNTGDGKGKTTAGLGTVLRALGRKQKIAVIQFIKGKWKTGEMTFLREHPEITYMRTGEGFTWDNPDREKEVLSAEKGWEFAEKIILNQLADEYDLLLLDEFNLVLAYGLLPLSEVCETLRNKSGKLSIIITGRSAPEKLIELADTVTEMKPLKHAFENGIKARKGVEF